MKNTRLTESDLNRIVKKVLNEQEISGDIKNGAKQLIGKTVKVLDRGKNALTMFGIFKITNATPNNKQSNMLGLSLTLNRLTNEYGDDVNDSAKYYLDGKCYGKEFKFNEMSRSKNGQYVDLKGKIPTKRLTEHLTNNWCSLYNPNAKNI